MTIIRILLILTALNRFVLPQELFDPYQVHTLNIQFYNPDWYGIINPTNIDDSSKKKYEISIRPESAEDLRKNYEAIEHIVIE